MCYTGQSISAEARKDRLMTALAIPLGVLYESDETAWLEAMSELIRLGRLEELDYPNLSEYLADLARCDRREVESRLTDDEPAAADRCRMTVPLGPLVSGGNRAWDLPKLTQH